MLDVLIAAFQYEIENVLDLALAEQKRAKVIDEFTINIKRYLEGRINQIRVEQKRIEDKLLYGQK